MEVMVHIAHIIVPGENFHRALLAFIHVLAATLRSISAF